MQRIARSIGLLLVAPILLSGSAAQEPQGRVSRFGEYRGYSEPTYDGWERSSFYVEVRDGTRLAVDLFRPTRDGVLHRERLPAVWTHHRYHRAMRLGGRMQTVVGTLPGLDNLLEHGYVVAAADVRGSGASFGSWQGLFTAEESRDAYDITEWLASQPWCSGRIGMYGGSYLGITQMMAAAEKPPHLVAIFPEMALFDLFEVVHSGGIYRDDLADQWSTIVGWLDDPLSPPERRPDTLLPVGLARVAPVDADADEKLLRAAWEEHRDNRLVSEIFPPLRYRDAVDPTTGARVYRDWSPSGRAEDISGSGVAIYHRAGWFDVFTRHAFLALTTLRNPQKLMVGPWCHTEYGRLDHEAEQLRWFDYWLKGVDNGVMDGPRVHYYLMGARRRDAWKSTDRWPLESERRTAFWFAPGPTGTVDSHNDGRLVGEPPRNGGADRYVVDYEATSGVPSRWSNAYGRGAPAFRYGNMRARDERCLTYTSPTLESDLVVTGHPVVTLWLKTEADDVDLFVRLEEVLADGTSRYVTEGCLRASHRKLSPAPFELPGALPFHSCTEADAQPLPAEAFEVVLDLYPTANVFDEGHRLRITVACADADNAATPERAPPPVLHLLHGGGQPSVLDLPVIPAGGESR